MRKTAAIIAAAALAITAHALTVEEARANLNAARAAYRAALAEAGVTSTPRRAVSTAATPVLTKSQAAYFKNRRICVGRDTTTLPGYVITTWHRNGKLDTKAPAVITNILRNVVGEEQRNPVQEIAERWRVAATNAQTQAQAWMANATNAQARVERVTAALDERRAEYVTKRDAAALPSTKLIYPAFIDAIDRIKERLDQEGE